MLSLALKLYVVWGETTTVAGGGLKSHHQGLQSKGDAGQRLLLLPKAQRGCPAQHHSMREHISLLGIPAHHRQGSLKKRHLLSHNSEGWKPEVKLS